VTGGAPLFVADGDADAVVASVAALVPAGGAVGAGVAAVFTFSFFSVVSAAAAVVVTTDAASGAAVLPDALAADVTAVSAALVGPCSGL
jgi:hypothetical protein